MPSKARPESIRPPPDGTWLRTVLDAMVEAVSAPLTGPGGCNAGFLRDDAILVVTFISDDEKIEDLNTAQQTHDALVAAKGGDADGGDRQPGDQCAGRGVGEPAPGTPAGQQDRGDHEVDNQEGQK